MTALHSCFPFPLADRGVSVEAPLVGSPACVAVAGELDEFSAPIVARALATHDATCRPLVVDVSGVSFLGAAGLRSLLAAMPDPVGLRLWRPSPAVRRVVSLLAPDVVLDDSDLVVPAAGAASAVG
jgi:anti-anti-sigma factor